MKALLVSLTLLTASLTYGDDVPEFKLIIKNHVFSPAEVIIPANTKVKLVVDNQDSSPEEFESHELNREKVIPGNSQAKIFVGPLNAGTYPFYGEFNATTAQGKITVK